MELPWKFDVGGFNARTQRARLYIKSILHRAEQMAGDPHKEGRIKRSLCRLCFYQGRICGQAFTSYICMKCGGEFDHHNTCVPKLCLACAMELEACAQCGADINLEDRINGSVSGNQIA